jgi:hypothetical protein
MCWFTCGRREEDEPEDTPEDTPSEASGDDLETVLGVLESWLSL